MGSFLTDPHKRVGKAYDAMSGPEGGGTIRVNGRVANGSAAFLEAISCLHPYSLGVLVGLMDNAQLQMERAKLPNQYIPSDMSDGRFKPLININIPDCTFDVNDSWTLK